MKLPSLVSLASLLQLTLIGLLVATLAACSAQSVDSESEQTSSQRAPLTTVHRIACGSSSVVDTFSADKFFQGGTSFGNGANVSVAGVANAAPAGVYKQERYGNFSYAITGLTPAAPYTVRLHFAEIFWTNAGSRVFNVDVNGARVLANFDIVALAGPNKALVRDFAASADASGRIVISYSSVIDFAKASGIEILAEDSAPPNQAPTIASAPSASPTSTVVGGTSNLSVLGADDGGEANLIYTWSSSGTPPAPVTFSVNGSHAAARTTASFSAAGNYTLLVTVRDQPGLTTTATVNVAVTQTPSTSLLRLNSGGPAVPPFAQDQQVSGGTSFSTSAAVSTAGVANAGPAAIYQSERYGDFTYTFSGLTAGGAYTVRLHFAEIYFTSAGQRVFDVFINGTKSLANYDIFAAAGANKAVVRDFSATANASGAISVRYAGVTNNAKSSAIELLSSSGTPNQAPSIATAAAANPASVTATTTALSVLGADDGGEASLTYTWATTGSPPAPVSFSRNGSNAAKTATATFSRAGSYGFTVTVQDAGGLSATSSVNVSVSQSLTSLLVSPASASVPTQGQQQFSAAGVDQFGNSQAVSNVAWSVTGGGSISSSGLFTAGGTTGGPFTVRATAAGREGSASVSVTNGSVTGRLLLRKDATNRYLVDGNGSPFLVFGEGAWTLNSQLSVAAQNAYLADRSGRGLNAFELQLISRYQDNSPNDADGVAPFTTPGDLATFNPLYFQKAADLVRRAGQRGMVAFIAPIWAGYDAGQGFYEMMVSNGATKVRNYGSAVANVFKDLDNVVWIIGGDRPAPVGSTTLFNELTSGIRSVDSRHLVTSHWNFAPGDSPSGNWEDIVSTYDWNGGVQYTQIRNEYDENDAPVLLLEGLYELNTTYGATTKILRLQTIQALLFGAKGTFFGHEGVWHLGASVNLPQQSKGHPYDLDSVGIRQQQNVRAFFAGRAWHALVPDLGSVLVTGGRGSYGSSAYVGAAKTPDGSFAAIYVPDGGTITVNLAQLKLPSVARWFDPTNGSYVAAGSFTTASSRTFTTPGNNSAGAADWLLVFDAQ